MRTTFMMIGKGRPEGDAFRNKLPQESSIRTLWMTAYFHLLSARPFNPQHNMFPSSRQPNDMGLADRKGPLREWVVMDAPRRQIAKQFHTFLTSFVDEKGIPVYTRRISEMCAGKSNHLWLN